MQFGAGKASWTLITYSGSVEGEREGGLAGHLISVNTLQHATHKALKRQEIIKSPAHGDMPEIGLHKEQRQTKARWNTIYSIIIMYPH